MDTQEVQLREELVRWGRSIFDRGLTAGSSGNISVRTADGGFLVTPTNSCLGFLDAQSLSKLDASGGHIGGDKPTKELPLHMAFYEVRPSARAVVHLHSTYATALSCLMDTDPQDAIAPITPYVVMRVGRVPVIPYTMPGSPDVAPMIREQAKTSAAVLLANHGPTVAGASLRAAVFAMEELEETARLLVTTHGMRTRRLTDEQVAELHRSFPRK